MSSTRRPAIRELLLTGLGSEAGLEHSRWMLLFEQGPLSGKEERVLNARMAAPRGDRRTPPVPGGKPAVRGPRLLHPDALRDLL